MLKQDLVSHLVVQLGHKTKAGITMTTINKFTKILFLTSLTLITLLYTGCSEEDTKDNTKDDAPSTENPTGPQPPVVQPDPYKTAGWYAKTEITATASNGQVYSHKTAGVFGQLVQSSDDQDQHDIAGYGPATLQVIFIPEFSTDTTAGFFSEYKNYDENSSEKKVWAFMVKNQNTVDLSNAPISISLNGTFDVKYRDDRGKVEYKETRSSDDTITANLHLVDVDNSADYTIAELSNAGLTMQGLHTRTFKWVLGSVDSTDYEPLPAAQQAPGRNGASDFKMAPERSGGGKFGLPPQ